MDVVGQVKSLLRTGSVHIDNYICQLHYRATVIIIVTFCAIISASQYIGNPIHCIGHSKWDSDYVNTHCWLSHTYSVLDKDGVITKTHIDAKDTTVVYHAYYQWMPFYLAFMAACFYLPRLVWKTWEGGLMKEMTCGLEDTPGYTMNNEDVKDKLGSRIYYFMNARNNHNAYLTKFCICEILNLVNVIIQFVLFNSFLGGQFFSYGSNVVKFYNSDNNDIPNPMTKVFPLTTSCLLEWGGPTGEDDASSQQCLLPQNIINDKITLILWFWFVILIAVTLCSAIYRFAYLIFPPLVRGGLQSHSRLAKPNTVCFLTQNCSTGACWFLQQMSKNMHPAYLGQMLVLLEDDIGTSRESSECDKNLLDTKC